MQRCVLLSRIIRSTNSQVPTTIQVSARARTSALSRSKSVLSWKLLSRTQTTNTQDEETRHVLSGVCVIKKTERVVR